MRKVRRLLPVFKDYMWGGTRLREQYGVTEMDRVAEAWVLSAHPDGMSVTEDGTPFADIWRNTERGARAEKFAEFPQLVKLIDAKDDLSVQVHPSDDYALAHEGQCGKTEMWYILHAEEGAGIYYGFKNEVTREQVQASIRQNTLTELLRFVPVKAGEWYFIPAGTVHAIGRGLLIAEIQQNSNVTYRLYDYGRRDKHGNTRELHVDKALAVANLSPMPTVEPSRDGVLAACEYFTVKRIRGEASFHTTDSFAAVLVMDGNGTINDEVCRPYDTFFIPSGVDVTVTGECDILLSYT